MRLSRFFTPRENIRVGSSVKLEQDDAAHIRKTLRLSKGDEIIVFNGEKEFKAEIKISSNEFVLVRLKELLRQKSFDLNDSMDLTLYQSIIKANYFETLLEKCTEIGVSRFIPLETEYGQITAARILPKFERWRRIIKSACKQSERIDIPNLSDPIDFASLVENLDAHNFDGVYALSLKDRKESQLSDINITNTFEDIDQMKNIALIIGPEGGFSPKEYQILKELNVHFVQINEHVLRSETAGIVASGIVKYLSRL